MPRVLISDKISPRAVAIFEERGITVDYKPGLSAEDLAACIKDYDGLAVRSNTKVTKDILSAGDRLKVVGRAGIGVDNVDVEAATAKGVVVMNTPFGNSVTTAEHAIALMFALARELPQADASTQAGKWEKSRFMGVEVTGKTLGVIGCGNIGTIVIQRALGLKMRVLGYDPFLTEERAEDLGIRKVDLDDLLKNADFITLHTPLTEGTRGIISKTAIAKMKKGAYLINCARGGLVDEAAVKEALENKHLAGVALDVFEVEPAKDNPLFGTPGLIATPHLGASTAEAQENVALQVAEQMSDYLMTGAVTNAVNMASVSAEEAPRLKPYMALAEKLGSLLGQMSRDGYMSIQIEFEGQVASLNTKPLVSSALAGLLKPMIDTVNPVSAPVIARQRNIDVSVTRHERDCDYQSLVRITTTSKTRTRCVAGTLIGGTKERIVDIMGIPTEAEFAPNMILVRNEDKPGLIGGLGTILGEAGVNIATFHLGRRDVGGEALALIEVDALCGPDVMEKMEALPQVKRVLPLKF